MRKLREFSTPAQTANTTFDQGKTRIIDVVYGPTGVYVKARGMKGWKFAGGSSRPGPASMTGPRRRRRGLIRHHAAARRSQGAVRRFNNQLPFRRPDHVIATNH